MEDYKKKIERKVRIMSTVCCLLPITMLLAKRLLSRFAAVNTPEGDFSSGIIFGSCIGGMLVFIFYLVKMFTALRDGEKLKQMYVEATDERNIAISKEAANTSMAISVLFLLFGVIVTGFISTTISLTLAAAMFLFVFVRLAVGVYYNKKM